MDLLQQEDLPPQVDLTKNYLEELVGEGKKFKSHEDLARGKFESDQYIELLKKRQDELRADYLREKEENNTRAKLEQLIDKISKPSSNDLPEVNEDNQPKFDPKLVDSLVDSRLQEYEVNKKQTENFNLVKEKLQSRYGKNYAEAVKNQIEDLGISEADLNDLARTKPKALIRALGLDQELSKESFTSPPRSEQRRDSFAPSNTQKRTWSYYQDLKRKNPNIYYDRKTAIQMQEDAISLGDAFKDGDYRMYGDN